VSCIGNFGKSAIAGKPLATNQQINSLIPSDEVDSNFLYYACKTLLPQMEAFATTTVVPILNKSSFASLQIPLPPLDEQHRIVRILDEVEAMRQLRARADERMAGFIPSLFNQMFGDPATNPKGWETLPLREMASKYSEGPFGSNLKTAHYTQTGVRVVRLQNIGVGRFVDDDEAYISQQHFAGLSKHRCIPGDVVIGTLGDPNLRACIIPDSIPEALNKADCVQLRPEPNIATADYICWMLNMPSTLGMAAGLILGQTRGRISSGRLAKLVLPLPPLKLQRDFAARVAEARALQDQQAQSRVRLEEGFQALLHRAFGGEL